MDSFELLQKLDKEHNKKSDYKPTVDIEDINKITAKRISENKLNEDTGLAKASSTPDKESISPEKTTRNLKPTLEVVNIVTEESNKNKDEKDDDAR